MMHQVSASPPQGMPYMMPLAQKPPYCGRYFCGAASNSALCAALAKWMVEVGGSQKPGEVKLTWIKNTVTGLDPAASTRWVHTKDPAHYQYFSFNAPVGAPAAEQCGRVVNSDIHVVSGMALVDDPFPTSCVTKGLTPQEKIIVFMLFDLSACLLPDSADPIPG